MGLAGAVCLVVLLAAGCQVKTEVNIAVDSNGTGEVTVAIGLDADAVNAVGDLSTAVRTKDLQARGWAVDAPVKETDGFTWIRARHPFADIGQANAALSEITGVRGAFRDFQLRRHTSFGATETAFSGTVDFSKGLDSFADSALTRAAGTTSLSQELGVPVGPALDKAFSIQVRVRLPGSVHSNAPLSASNGAVWQPRLSQPIPAQLTATGRERRWAPLLLVGLAVVAAVAAVGLATVSLTRRRRSMLPH